MDKFSLNYKYIASQLGRCDGYLPSLPLRRISDGFQVHLHLESHNAFLLDNLCNELGCSRTFLINKIISQHFYEAHYDYNDKVLRIAQELSISYDEAIQVISSNVDLDFELFRLKENYQGMACYVANKFLSDFDGFEIFEYGTKVVVGYYHKDKDKPESYLNYYFCDGTLPRLIPFTFSDYQEFKGYLKAQKEYQEVANDEN